MPCPQPCNEGNSPGSAGGGSGRCCACRTATPFTKTAIPPLSVTYPGAIGLCLHNKPCLCGELKECHVTLLASRGCCLEAVRRSCACFCSPCTHLHPQHTVELLSQPSEIFIAPLELSVAHFPFFSPNHKCATRFPGRLNHCKDPGCMKTFQPALCPDEAENCFLIRLQVDSQAICSFHKARGDFPCSAAGLRSPARRKCEQV